MYNSFKTLFALFASLALIGWGGSILIADQHAKDKNQAPADDGWEVLFDGTSTDAFRGWKMEGYPEKGWLVEDAVLQMKGKHEKNDLITKKTYRDFDLRWEWKAGAHANSGVMYRVSEEPEESFHTGPEYQILGTKARNNGGRKQLRVTASLYDLIPNQTATKPADKDGWNTARIRLHKDQVEHWLNGKIVVSYEWGGDKVKAIIAKTKFNQWDRFMKEQTGHIAFQNHDGTVLFRNIRIKDLSK